MYEVSVEHTFAAGHALRGYKGKCENVHGHNYKVQVTVAGEKLNATGLLIDFIDLRAALRDLSERLDHRFMNDVPPFDTINPSAENMAKYFSDGIDAQIRPHGVRVAAVKVWETETTSATFIPSA